MKLWISREMRRMLYVFTTVQPDYVVRCTQRTNVRKQLKMRRALNEQYDYIVKQSMYAQYDSISSYYSFRQYIQTYKHSSYLTYVHDVKDILCDVKSIYRLRIIYTALLVSCFIIHPLFLLICTYALLALTELPV